MTAHESPPPKRGAIAEVVPPASDSDLVADSTARLRQALATLGWDNAGIDLLLAMRGGGFVVCPAGHRQWSRPSTPCVWCAAVERGLIDATVELGGQLVRVPVPFTNDEALALSWWREVP